MLTVLFDRFFDVSLFGYISFRAAMAAMTAFLCALLLGRPVIEWLKAHQVREDVSKTDSIDLARLAESMGKHKTPTMGGSFLVLSLLLSVALWCRLDNLHVVLGLVLTAGLAAVGFIDDYKKLTVPHSNGLSTGAKLLGQTAVTLFAVLALVWYAHASDRYSLLTIYPPFFKDVSISLHLFVFRELVKLIVEGILLFLFYSHVVFIVIQKLLVTHFFYFLIVFFLSLCKFRLCLGLFIG